MSALTAANYSFYSKSLYDSYNIYKAWGTKLYNYKDIKFPMQSCFRFTSVTATSAAAKRWTINFPIVVLPYILIYFNNEMIHFMVYLLFIQMGY